LTTTTISRPTVQDRSGELPPSMGTWNIARGNSTKSIDIAMVNQGDAPENGQREPADAIASPGKSMTPTVMPASTRLK
jgi:hypothetical protein